MDMSCTRHRTHISVSFVFDVIKPTDAVEVGVCYLEAGDGVFPGLCQRAVDPGDNGVIDHFLSVTKVLQDVQGVPEGGGG